MGVGFLSYMVTLRPSRISLGGGFWSYRWCPINRWIGNVMGNYLGMVQMSKFVSFEMVFENSKRFMGNMFINDIIVLSLSQKDTVDCAKIVWVNVV